MQKISSNRQILAQGNGIGKGGRHETRKKFTWPSSRQVGLNGVRILFASGLKETES